MNTDEIKKELLKNKDEKYQKFASSLLPNINNVLGVRLPILRKLSAKIAKGNWQDFLNTEELFFEQTLLKAFVIGKINCNANKKIQLIENFLPKIDNWSVCDSFVCSLKFTKENKELLWDYILKYAHSKEEFKARFCYVMLLTYFVEENYLSRIFKIADNFRNEKYYAQMALAWLICTCYTKFPIQTFKFIKTTNLDKITLNRALQKIIESNYTDKNEKEKIRALKS